MDDNNITNGLAAANSTDHSIQIGSTWPSYDTLVEALRAEAIRDNWILWVYRRSKSQGTLILRCRKTLTCHFHLRARVESDDHSEKVVIRALRNSHTCTGAVNDNRSPLNSMDFLKHEVPRLLTVTEGTPTKDIQDVMLRHFDHRLPLKQAQRIKQCLISEARVQLPGQQPRIAASEYVDLPEPVIPAIFPELMTEDEYVAYFDDTMQPAFPHPLQTLSPHDEQPTKRRRRNGALSSGETDLQAMQKPPQTCSKCNQPSHNRKTCGLSVEARRWTNSRRMQTRRDKIAAALAHQEQASGAATAADDDNESGYS